MERARSALARLTAACACAALAACASITANDSNTLAPVGSVTLSATAVNGSLSTFTSGLSVSSAVLVRAAGGTATVTPTAGGVSGMTYSYSFAPAQPFRTGDVLTVNWHGDSTSGSVDKSTTNTFVSPGLKVQTPWGGLHPGEAGKVCVAFVNASGVPVAIPVTTAVSLTTQVFPGGLSPGTLTVAAGQAKPPTAATLTANSFSCPQSSSGASSGIPFRPQCDATRGVVATASYDGATLTACEETGGTCCGVNGQGCSGPPPPPSICP